MPTILAVDDNAPEIARRLLDAAGDQPDRVQVVTGHRYLGFAVDDDLARAAGFVIDDEPDEPGSENPDSTDDPAPGDQTGAEPAEPVTEETPVVEEGEPVTLDKASADEPVEPVAEAPAKTSKRSNSRTK